MLAVLVNVPLGHETETVRKRQRGDDLAIVTWRNFECVFCCVHNDVGKLCLIYKDLLVVINIEGTQSGLTLTVSS